MKSFGSILLALAGWGFIGATPSGAATWVHGIPDSWAAMEQSPAARGDPSGAIRFSAPFRQAMDRVYWDIPVTAPGAEATSIAVQMSCPLPSAIRGVSLHVQTRSGWSGTSLPLVSKDRATLDFQFSDFSPALTPDLLRSVSALRFTLWKGSDANTEALVYSIELRTPSILIFRGSESTAPGETALARQCALRAGRLFEKAGLQAGMVTDDLDRLGARTTRIGVLPYNPNLTPDQLDQVDRFVQRGGRIVVFYSGNPRLADLLGMEMLPFKDSKEDWTTISLDAPGVKGLPAELSHLTRNIIPIRARDASALTLGFWNFPGGGVDRSLPAAAVSPRGLAFSHIPPLATPSAVEWLLAALAHSDRSMKTTLEARLAEHRALDDSAVRLRRDESAPAGDMRGMWTLPLNPLQRSSTLRALSGHGMNAVFEPICTLALNPAEQPSAQRRMARLIHQAHESGVQLHVWFRVFNAEAFADQIPALAREGRMMQNPEGKALNWLCPLHPENQRLISSTLATLADLKPDGIQLDYIRYPSLDGCYCPLHRKGFEQATGEPVRQWPGDVLPGGARAGAYEAFRTGELTRWLATEMKKVRARSPDIRLSAAVYPTVESAAANGQDWPAWLRDGILDFASPMLYVEDSAQFETLLQQAVAAAPSSARIRPGIGVSADQSQLDALETARQIAITRRAGASGYILFQLDAETLHRILPILHPLPSTRP